MLDPERVSLVYAGRFGSYGRDPRPFVEAVRRLGSSRQDLAARLEVAVAGPLRDDEKALFDGIARDPVKVTLLGSLEREQSLALQRRADALLLLAQPTRSQLVNFKLFEYLAAARPILGLCAGTEAGRILGEGGVPVFAADDAAAIAEALARLATTGLADPGSVAARPLQLPGRGRGDGRRGRGRDRGAGALSAPAAGRRRRQP